MKSWTTRALVRMLLAAAGVLAALAPRVHGHGLMVHPPSRNWLTYTNGGFWEPHALSAGGVRTVSDGNQLRWPVGKHGLCGDTADTSRWDQPGRVTTEYRPGQEIIIDSLIQTNHLGRIGVEVCPLDAKEGQGRCTPLLRTDSGNKRWWYLPFLENWSGGNTGNDRPSYGDGFSRQYSMPRLDTSMGCKNNGQCDMFSGMVVYRTTWRLPANMTCSHCKLQWYYMTAQSCWPPCPAANRDEPTCENNQPFPTCGTPGAAYPEEFWNCADIRIQRNASDPDATRTPWESRIQMRPRTFGTPRVVRMNGHRRLLGLERTRW